MKKFCIIGVAGFVAKKHLKCIESINGKVIAACDKHDNVGFLDSFYPEAVFFKNEKKFFQFVKKNKPDYLVVCSPSYLHFKHIISGLSSKTNIIVEKPPVLNLLHLKQIYKAEKINKKKCYCIFQLRVDDKIIKLRNKLINSKKFNKVKIHYTTYRGDWYFKTWKNIKKLSGGLAINIGIHFFDILFWLFGDIISLRIQKKTNKKVKGFLKLTNANINWHLSTEKVSAYNSSRYNFNRYMIVNNKKYNFDKFNDLHKKNYDMIIKKNKFHISEFEKTIKFMKLIK